MKKFKRFYKPVTISASIFLGIVGLLNLLGVVVFPSWLLGLVVFGLSFSLLVSVIVRK